MGRSRQNAEEVHKKKYFSRAWYVTEKLGEERKPYNSPGTYRRYRIGELEIAASFDEDHDSGTQNFRDLTIAFEYNGRTVFEENRHGGFSLIPSDNTLRKYSPGEWEKEFEQLYQRAKRMKRRRQQDEWDFRPEGLLD